MELIILVVVILLGLGLFWLYLNRRPKHEAVPARFTCVDLNAGSFSSFSPSPQNIFGIGLSYANHINEVASDVKPNIPPPIFRKAISSLIEHGSTVKLPPEEVMIDSLEKLEPGISGKMNKKIKELPVLLDHEVELAFVLLKDVTKRDLEDPGYAPELGFFIANDLSARSVAVLGTDRQNIYEYWGVSKSYLGFTPYSDQLWIPDEFTTNTIPLVRLQTRVNGEIRQDALTDDMIYTPKEMLGHILTTQSMDLLKKGDIVLTGTPGGVILNLKRWKLRLADILGMDRVQKLRSQIRPGKAAKFLKAGDKVVVEGIGLGKAEVVIEG